MISILIILGFSFLIAGMILEKEFIFWIGVFLLAIGIINIISTVGLPIYV